MSSLSAIPSRDSATDGHGNAELDQQSGGIGGGLRSFVAKIETLAQKRPLFFAAAIVTVLFAAVIWAMPPAYQSNDDAQMNMIAAGQGIVLEPDEHLIFTNVIIGKLLKALYTRYPDLLWYGWYLVATQWVATIGLLYSFLRPCYSRLRMLGFGLYFFTAGIHFLTNLQFTSTASLAGFAGVMLLLQLLRASFESGREKFAVATAAMLMMAWGGLVRNETFMLTLMLACPVFLATYWFDSANRKAGLMVCAVVGGATCLMYFSGRYHQECYSEPGWQGFYEYNYLRAKVNDERWVEYTPESKHVFDQVGWSENDYDMMMNCYFDDPIFDGQILNTILTGHPWKQDRKYGTLLRETMGEVLVQRTIRTILCCLPFLLLFFDRTKQRLWHCAAAVVMAVAILLAITIMRKPPPERVFIPVLTFPWLVLLSSLALHRRGGELQAETFSQTIQSVRTSWQLQNWSLSNPAWSKHFLLRTVTLLLFVGLIWNVRQQYRQGKLNVANWTQYETILANLRPSANEPERLALAFSSDFPYEFQPALFGGSNYRGLYIYALSWTQRTPMAERIKKRFNITTLGQALAEKHDMLLVLHSGSFGPRVMEYLAAHYGKGLQMVNLKHYWRGSLMKIEPLQGFRENQGIESPILSTKPDLDSNKSR